MFRGQELMLQSEKDTNLTCAAGWAMSPMIKLIVGRGAFDCGDDYCGDEPFSMCGHDDDDGGDGGGGDDGDLD